MTLVGVAVAGFLIWLASQIDDDTSGGYWAEYGLLAAAGLTIALSQLLGGWTKWGWPRVSGPVFLLGFLPALIAGGWVLLAKMPAEWGNTSNWSRDLAIDGLVDDLGTYLGVLAFGIGLVFGLTFDTTGRRARPTGETYDRRQPVDEYRAADEPLAAERAAAPEYDETVVGGQRTHEERIEAGARATPVAPQPEPPPRAGEPR